ncbi:MAG: hypothetical protein ACK4R9_12785 [Ignavibacterium sp.]
MKVFDIVLTKSYLVRIVAEDPESALRFAEFFTGDIQDISTETDREIYKFIIQSIDNKINEASSFEIIDE